MARCPKCDKPILSLRVDALEAMDSMGASWKGAVFSCPNCSYALGAGIDPVALGDDIVSEVLKGLGKG